MKKKTAFTFIEIMIAIVIFSIGILSILKLVTSNLSLMDKNNLRTQSTLLAKEWIELIYNLRDANIAKELDWNCLMNDDMYGWSLDNLAQQISLAGWDENAFKKVICKGYFTKDNYLKISFDKKMHVYSELSDKHDIFNDNYESNKLYLYTGDIGWYDMSWYAYQDESLEGIDTYFARYLSFEEVKEGDNELSTDKILKVTSHVLYNKMWFTGEVKFESFIWNY